MLNQKLSYPRFAVVGHPNKGKSSIVATLAHNDSIHISSVSGTTQIAEEYPYSIDGNVQYALIDTPGFQRPRQVLAELQHIASNASERAGAIQQFLDRYQASEQHNARFRDEVELLTPIMQGSGIIYVVDGSVPYAPEYETEMTILQWTGQPRMALINVMGTGDYMTQWQQALGQYFSHVKVYNPIEAGVDKQLAVLSAFSELESQWAVALKSTIEAIRLKHQQRKSLAAMAIADAMQSMIKHQASLPVVTESARDLTELTLKKQYQSALKTMEQNLRQQIIELYAHYHLQWDSSLLDAQYPDMFDQDYWYLFGLTRPKMVALAASAGAAAGGVLDVGLGGASFMAGAMAGGLFSGAASLFLTAKPDQIRLKGIALGGQQLKVGPIKHLQFTYVLLGRAIQHYKAVSARTHADQRVLYLEQQNHIHWIDQLDKKQQLLLTRLLQKAAKGLSAKDRTTFNRLIERLI